MCRVDRKLIFHFVCLFVCLFVFVFKYEWGKGNPINKSLLLFCYFAKIVLCFEQNYEEKKCSTL